MKKILLRICPVVLTLGLLTVFSGCGGGDDPSPVKKPEKFVPANFTELIGTLFEANALFDSDEVEPSEDGADVEEMMMWVPQAVWDALKNAIAEADRMIDDSINGTKFTQKQADAMRDKLKKAMKDFEGAQLPGEKPSTPAEQSDLDALQVLIDEAQELLDTTESASNALSVPNHLYWVSESEYATLENALANAEKAHAGGWHGPVTAALETLEFEIEEFNKVRHLGTGWSIVTTMKDIADKLAEAQARIEEIEEDTEAIAEDSPIAGLFLKFGEKGYSNVDKQALEDAMDAAEAIDENSSEAEAMGALNNLTAAIPKLAIKDGLGMEFIDVPAGVFNAYGGTTSLNTTAYTRTITRAYRITKYPVTVGQWEAVMGTDWPNGDRYDSFRKTNNPHNGQPRIKYPAVRLSWYDGIAFSNKLSALMGKPLVYSVSGIDAEFWETVTAEDVPAQRPTGVGTNNGNNPDSNWYDNTTATWDNKGYRLPTEMEWQWAAMGAYSDTTGQTSGTNTAGYRKAFAGQKASAVTNAGTEYTDRALYAWLAPAGSDTATNGTSGTWGVIPVDYLLPNELDIYCMSGNVFEWCWDWIDGGNNTGVDANNRTDYRGPNKPSGNPRKVGHGGDWWNQSGNGHAAKDRPSIWNRTGYHGYIGYDQSSLRIVIEQ